jgi:hypothetical protein
MTRELNDRARLRNVYHQMMHRCFNPTHKSFHRYGGRGITVCEEWKGKMEDFIKWALANGWQYGLQIDRRNNDLGYSPDNCHFVTRQVQRANYDKVHESRVLTQAQLDRYADPTERKKTSEAITKSWEDPNRREKQTESMQAAWQHPERMERGKEEMRRRWSDPEYKARMSESIKRSWNARKKSKK